jgi:beta propeller repeat protein
MEDKIQSLGKFTNRSWLVHTGKGLFILLIVFIMLVSTNVSLQAGTTISRVTTNAYEEASPHMKGDYLVWQGQVDGDWEIFLHNVATGECLGRITANGYDDISPQTDGNYVVWLGFSLPSGETFLPGGEIFLYDITKGQITRVTNDSNVESYPQIANGRVVWASHAVGNSVEPGEIFLYDIATGLTEQLTNDARDDSSPRIDDQSVVWVQEDITGTTSLFIYDIAQATIQPAPDGFVWTDSPQSDGDLTVLTRYDGSDREVFVHSANLGTYYQITDNDLEDRSPVISGSNIAWVQGEGLSSEIFVASQGPVIERLRPRNCNPGEVLRIIGSGFGNTQGDSVLHIGPKIYDSSHPRIRFWSDERIRIRIPFKKKSCAWYTHGDSTHRRRKVWVTVGGVDSNKERIRVLKPGTCP